MIENMSEFGVLIVYWLMGLLRVKDSVESWNWLFL